MRSLFSSCRRFLGWEPDIFAVVHCPRTLSIFKRRHNPHKSRWNRVSFVNSDVTWWGETYVTDILSFFRSSVSSKCELMPSKRSLDSLMKSDTGNSSTSPTHTSPHPQWAAWPERSSEVVEMSKDQESSSGRKTQRCKYKTSIEMFILQNVDSPFKGSLLPPFCIRESLFK